MCEICEDIINEIWENIQEGQTFRTPDLYRGVNFTVQAIDENRITITPQNISISRAGFISAIHFLRENHHCFCNPCRIKSSNNRESSGPLCVATRDENNNVRCVNYILPILEENNVVAIRHERPNSTWLLRW